MQNLTPAQRNAQNTSAAQQYLNAMALSHQSSNRKSNRSVANTSNRSNFRSTGSQKLEPLPPRQIRGTGSVSGRKSTKAANNRVDAVLFPADTSMNGGNEKSSMIMLGNASNKSNFQKAYEKTNNKKDYISMVSSSMPLDVKSDNGMYDDN